MLRKPSELRFTAKTLSCRMHKNAEGLSDSQRTSANSRYGNPSAKPTSYPGAKSGSVARRAGSLPAPLPPALPAGRITRLLRILLVSKQGNGRTTRLVHHAGSPTPFCWV